MANVSEQKRTVASASKRGGKEGASPVLPDLSRQAQLNLDHLFDGLHVALGQMTHTVFQSRLAHGAELVSHCLVAAATNADVRFAWKELVHAAGERHNLHAVEVPVGSVVAHDDRRPLLAHLAAHSRLEFDPPDISALHWPRPRWSLRPIPGLRPRALPARPFSDSRDPGPCRP